MQVREFSAELRRHFPKVRWEKIRSDEAFWDKALECIERTIEWVTEHQSEVGQLEELRDELEDVSAENEALRLELHTVSTLREQVSRLEALLDKLEQKPAPRPAPKKKPAAKKKEPMQKYGEYKHVLLNDTQYSRLIKEFGEKKTADYIRKVDEYVQQTGKKYNDYNLTVRKFMRDDGGKDKPEQEHSYDLNKILEHSMQNVPTIGE